MASPTAVILGNPAKRRSKTKARKTMEARKRNPVKKVTRRRNPIKKKGIIDTQIMPALIGGAGAVGAGLAFEYLEQFLPEEAKAGYVKYLAEGGVIIAAGMIMENMKVGDKKLRDNLVSGGLTVISYKMLEEFAKANELITTQAGYQRVDGYQRVNGYTNVNSNRMGRGMGWQTTAQVHKRA